MTTSSSRDGSRKKTRGSPSRAASSGRGSRKAAPRPRRPVVEAPAPEPVAPIVPQSSSTSPSPFRSRSPPSRARSPRACRRPSPSGRGPPAGARSSSTSRTRAAPSTSPTSSTTWGSIPGTAGPSSWPSRTGGSWVTRRRGCWRRAERISCTAPPRRASATGATCASPSPPGSGWRRPGPATSSRSCPTTAPSTPWETSPPAWESSSVACPIAVSRRTRRRRWWSRRRAGRSRRARALQARAAGVAAGGVGPVVRRRRSERAERRHADSRADSREGSRHGASGHARGGRTGGGRGRPASSHAARPQPEPPQTTAPHDELVSVVRGLVEAAPKRSVSIDSVANALKSRGFQRSPGSPRLVTRLRRIKELLVSPSGTITLAEDGAPPASDPQVESSAARDRAAPGADRRQSSWPTAEAAETEDSRRRPSAGLPQLAGQRARAARDRRQPGRARVRRRRPALRLAPAAGAAAVGAGAAVHASRLRGPTPADPAARPPTRPAPPSLRPREPDAAQSRP